MQQKTGYTNANNQETQQQKSDFLSGANSMLLHKVLLTLLPKKLEHA